MHLLFITILPECMLLSTALTDTNYNLIHTKYSNLLWAKFCDINLF